jgi:DNA-binding response OmpR family regulator
MKILLVDDEPPIIQALEYNLRREGFETVSANSGGAALDLFAKEKPDLVVLDIMLPGLSGIEVCRALRKRSTVPIILLTARAEEMDRVVGLEVGADDYVVKPFSARELVARVKAHLRRATQLAMPAAAQRLICDSMVIDLSQHVFLREGKEVLLSPKEFQLLVAFMSRRGVELPRRDLLRLAGGDDSFIDERTVDVHVRWLREKIEQDPGSPYYIQTVRGIGYRFRAEG